MRSAITFLFCVCASFFLRAQDSVRNTSGAVLKFDTTTFWMGNVYQGSTTIGEFKFTNAGKEPLVIVNANSSGGGLVAEYPKQPIPPGQKGVIKFHFNSTGKVGAQHKCITVVSNDPRGNAILNVKGVIIVATDPSAPIMVFDSTSYWFDTVYQSTIIEHDFRFTNKGKTPLIISSVTGNSGCIAPEYPIEPIAPGKSAVISVRFHTGGKMGMQDKCVTVISNASEPTIVLHIKGVVVVPSKLEYIAPIPANKSNH